MHTGRGGKHPHIDYHLDRLGDRWPNDPEPTDYAKGDTLDK